VHPAGHRQQGALVFGLTMEAGKWLIADVDFEDNEGVTSGKT
jgi:hypothetical protein